MSDDLKIWVFGCSHVGTDITHGVENLEEAARDAEEYGFDIAINLGDVSGQQGLPLDSEGEEFRSQIGFGLKNHLPEDIYSLCGNHDRTDGAGLDSGAWFCKWLDPMGENTAFSGIDNDFRRFPVEGAWNRYKVQIGNLVFLFIGDIERPQTPMRGTLGGDPGGVVNAETYQWWKDQCALYRDGPEIVITFAHYMPKDTTCATGEYEGGYLDENGIYHEIYHGPGISNGRYSSFLAYVDETPGRPFIEWLEQHPGDCAAWFGAHNHVHSGQPVGGKNHVVTMHGCTFVQNGHLTRYHGNPADLTPKSRFLTFQNGTDSVRMDAYFHTDAVIPKGLNPNFKTISLPRAVDF